MEGRFVVTALIFTILAACSKQDIHRPSFQDTLLLQKTEIKPQVFSSGWETVPAWTEKKSSEGFNFSYTRQLAEVTNSVLQNGVVLVYARNLWDDDPNLKDLDKVPEKPLMMPFYFLPYFERPDYTEQWNYSVAENQINVSLLVKGSDKASLPGKKTQLRFVVIPHEVLNAKRQSAETVRKLAYDQLIQMFGLNS